MEYRYRDEHWLLRILDWLWPVQGRRAITLGGIPYIPRGAENGIGFRTTMKHELVHARQQKEDGWLFYARYIFWPPWRARYEMEAFVTADIEDQRRTVDQVAEILWSWQYLWAMPPYWTIPRMEQAVSHGDPSYVRT